MTVTEVAIKRPILIIVAFIAITLMAVAATASRMINLEKECWRLKAILRAMKEERFKMRSFSVQK